MASPQDLVVRLRVIDEATPAIRRLQRQLWWFYYGPFIATAIIALLGTVVGFIAGLQVP